MKTIKNLLFVAFAAMAIAACQKELANPDTDTQAPVNTVTFTGLIDDAQPQTKTTMWYEDGLEKGKITTYFMKADRVVVNGVESGDIIKEDNAGSIFSFGVSDVKAPYYAVSADQVETKDKAPIYDAATHRYSIIVSGSQKYRRSNGAKYTSHHSGADIFAAYSEDETMKFKHLSTFLAITVDREKSTETANIKNVYVRQGDGSNIAGRWYVKYDENNKPYVEPETLTNYITYACVVADWDISKEGLPQGNPMIVGVPSYNYENGLLITLEDMNGKFSVFKIPATKTQYAAQGGVIIPFNPGFAPTERTTISSAAEWNSFATYLNVTSGKGATGTIKLTNNITADNLIQIANFKGVFDGGNKTITLNNATQPLFGTVTGEVKNLIVDGTMNAVADDENTVMGAPFVGTLKEGGKITDCTNEMEVKVGTTENPLASHVYASGFAAQMYEGTINGCTNNGTLDVFVDVSAENYRVAVGGIVGNVLTTTTMTLKDCANTAAVTLTPKSGESYTNGMIFCGLGGVAGVFRQAATYVLDNCDNSGQITLSAAKIVSEEGLAARIISVGGIIGIGAPINASSGVLNNVNLDDYPQFNTTLTRCDNTGKVYNCGINRSSSSATNNKVFTGGLAGCLAGNATTYATVTSCTNTGTVLTYDLVGNDSSSRPGYCAVASGFIGFGAWLNMSKCTVNCEIGEGKRPMAAWAGVIGFALRPFTLTESDVFVKGYFQRFLAYKMNRAVVAVMPQYYLTLNDANKEVSNKMAMEPDLAGSSVTNCKLGGILNTSGKTLSEDNKSDLSSSLTTPLFNGEDKTENNIFAGSGYAANKNCNFTVEKESLTYWTGN